MVLVSVLASVFVDDVVAVGEKDGEETMWIPGPSLTLLHHHPICCHLSQKRS